MKLRVLLISVLLSSFVAAPASSKTAPIDQLSYNEIVALISSNSDPYVGYDSIDGPDVEFKEFLVTDWSWHLSAVRSPKAKVFGILLRGYIIYNGDWRMYDHAWFLGGEPAAFSKVAQHVIDCHNGCTMSESFRITIPRDKLFAPDAAILGINIKITGDGPELYAKIPPNYVRAFRSKVQAFAEGYTEDK